MHFHTKRPSRFFGALFLVRSYRFVFNLLHSRTERPSPRRLLVVGQIVEHVVLRYALRFPGAGWEPQCLQ